MNGPAYAGIGSRKTPEAMRHVFAEYARRLAKLGWTLRSGRAPGADSYFQLGATGSAELYVAGDYGPRPVGARLIVPEGELLDRALLVASTVHPAWERCSSYTRLLLARNVFQVYGERLDENVEFLVAWAVPHGDGSVEGGTNLAWTLAGIAGIPRYNLCVPADERRFCAMLTRLEVSGAPTLAERN
jgi:hypothetical protein